MKIGVVDIKQEDVKGMINRDDMLELTRRMTPARASIGRIAGAYFDEEGKYDETKQRPMIALTFDDGPSTADTNGTSDLLDVLEQYDSRATFFCVGNNINDKSGPLLKRMVELGCEVGNHSYDHAQLTKLDAKGVHDEIDTTNELIKKYSGRDCRIIRPPYGAADNDIVPANVSQPFIMWDVDTEDWKSLNASKVIASVERYRNQDWDGAVILMHDIHPTTVEACKTLIPELVNAGYQLVTVSELAYLKGVKLEPGKSYWGIGEKSTETDY